MARKRNREPPRKRHHSERFRASNLVIERWTNAKSGIVGFHIGQHKSSIDVAKILRDGTSPETIRRMTKLWQLPMEQAKRGFLVELGWHKRQLLLKQAEKLGIEPEEFLKRVCECVLSDRLYEAVVDGRYK